MARWMLRAAVSTIVIGMVLSGLGLLGGALATPAPAGGYGTTGAPASEGVASNPASVAIDSAVQSLEQGTAHDGSRAVTCQIIGPGQATCGARMAPSHPVETPSRSPASAPAAPARGGPVAGQGPLPTGPGVRDRTYSSSLVTSAVGGRPHLGSANLTGPFWYNVTSNLSFNSISLPSPFEGNSMAYDPVTSYVVLFEGCSFTVCVDNETWVYSDGAWSNLTGTLTEAPSARYFASMAFDPGRDGVVLTGGGSSLVGVAYNDTWLFTNTWQNITSQVGLIPADGNLGGVYAGAMAWDPATQGLVLSDGCLDTNCSDVWSATWFLNSTTGWSALTDGPGRAAASYLSFGSVAYDPVSQEMLWFGGFDYWAAASENYTYTFTPSTGWTNITLNDGGCFILTCSLTPAGRDGAGMTWDGQIGAVFLVGGYNATADLLYNDSWIFFNGSWYPTDLISPTPAAFAPVFSPTLAADSTNVSPFVVGGLCGTAFCSGNDWVWEQPPVPQVHSVTPNPVDNNSTAVVDLTRVIDGGSGPDWFWTVSFGDGTEVNAASYGTNSSTPLSFDEDHSYTAPGVYPVAASLEDFFTIEVESAAFNVTVGPSLAATATAAPLTVDTGQSVAFTAHGINGTGPYTYSWNFGDGSVAVHTNTTSHSYTTGGTYHAVVTVMDAGGGSVQVTKTVTVNPVLSATAAATPTSANTGVTVTFSASATGGSGTYTYAWAFGDGSTHSATQNPTHTYSAVGTYTATLWVNDSLGSSVQKTVSVAVTAPSSSSSSSAVPGGPTTIILLVVVVLVVVGLLALFLLRRKKPGMAAPATAPSAGTPPPTGAGGPPPGAMGGNPPPP